MEQDFETPTKFKKFFINVNIFKKQELVAPEQLRAKLAREALEKEKTEVNTYINDMIQSGNSSAISKIIDENIAFNSKHLTSLFKINFQFTSSSQKESFLINNKATVKECIVTRLKLLSKQEMVGESSQVLENMLSLTKNIKEIYFDDKDFINDVYKAINTSQDFLNINSYTSLLYGGSLFVKEIHKELYSKYNEYNQDKLNQVIRIAKTLNVNKSDIDNDIAKSMHESINQFKLSNIPDNATNILNDIKLKSLHLMKNLDSLSQIDNLDFNNLYNKRLPKVLQEYAVISQDYKNKLKFQIVTPDTLLIESLNLINERLISISETLQDKQLHAMKVSNSYLKIV